MKSCLRIIFLLMIISCHVGAVTVPRQTMVRTVRQKAQQAYLVTCQKMRTCYDHAKEHKKIIAAIAAYVAFECVGYSKGWRTPFCRLFILPGKLDAELRTARTTIQNQVTQIAQLNNDHQQELHEQQQAQQEWQQRHDGVKGQLDDLLATDMGKQVQESKQAYQELTERYDEIDKQLQTLQNRQKRIAEYARHETENWMQECSKLARKQKEMDGVKT